MIQRLYNYIRGVDSFQLGAMIRSTTHSSEGSYATDDAVDSPEPDQAVPRDGEIHQGKYWYERGDGRRLQLSHTNAAGPSSKYSVLDKVVPWYYQRLNETTGSVENSTCCSNTAPENAMFAS